MDNRDFGVDPGELGSDSNDLERELLRRVSHGDREAFRDLYVRYHRRLARFLTRLLRRIEDVEEVINDTLWAQAPATVSDTTGTVEERQLLEWGLAQLPLEQRQVLEFTYCLDHSREEIAEIMDCPANTIKTHMFHGRCKLRSILNAAASGMEGRL